MGKYQRTKGAKFERYVANLWKAAGFPNARRGIGQMRAAGEVADADPLGGEPARPERGELPLWIEAKVGSPSWRAAMKQAVEAINGRQLIPLVVTRDDNCPEYAHLELSVLLAMLKAIHETPGAAERVWDALELHR